MKLIRGMLGLSLQSVLKLEPAPPPLKLALGRFSRDSGSRLRYRYLAVKVVSRYWQRCSATDGLDLALTGTF